MIMGVEAAAVSVLVAACTAMPSVIATLGWKCRIATIAMALVGMTGAATVARSSDGHAMFPPSPHASPNVSDAVPLVLASATDPTLADLRQRAIEGDPAAQFALGEKFEKGFGVNQDYEQALNWYTLSAQKGYVLAQWHLAYMYYEGRGTQKDLNAAMMWFEKAAASGDESARSLAAKIKAELNGPTERTSTGARLMIAILNNLALLDREPSIVRTPVPFLTLAYGTEPTKIEALKQCPAGRASYAVSDQSTLRLHIIDNPFPDPSDATGRDFAIVVKGDEFANFFNITGSNSLGAQYLERIQAPDLADNDYEKPSATETFPTFFFDTKMQQFELFSSEDRAPSAIFISKASRSFLWDGETSEYMPAQFWFLVACRPDFSDKTKSSGARPLD